MKLNILLIFLTLFFVGCSSNNDWIYTFSGESTSWKAVMDIEPYVKEDSTGVVYTFKIAKKIDNKVSKIHYEAKIPNSENGGNLDSVDLEKINKKELLKIFNEFPNLVDPNWLGKDTDKKELETYFSELQIDINWEDENGKHSEKIILQLN
ncbi:hypothetical protein P4V43_01580 [Brevibacillus fortis]|uniref:hypothetical protein n=1 Tax=Brevibacillus fortis TaxID=2126352 RepID=UPI002E1A596E|nr:hypothetical protein [Brevibacillus fortis]